MQEMLGQQMRPPIALSKFLSDYKNALPLHNMPSTQTDIQKCMNLLNEDERFHSIENCNLWNLSQYGDAHVAKFIPGFTEMQRKNETHIPENALQLRTLKTFLKSKETAARNPFKRSHEIYKLVKLPTYDEESDETCDFYNDLIVTVRFYRPARVTHIGRSLEKPVFAEEFECLGSNLLTELRDKISCVCNKKHFFDISDNPTAELSDKLTDPGFFFITDTFYNDHRNPNNPDYSDVIRKWAKTAIGLRDLDFKIAAMGQVRFIDLTVSLGFPQLYQHHGNCEHVFTFSQIEILTPSALCTKKVQYPRLRSFSHFNNRLCNMCGAQHYAFIVEQSDRQLHDPAYLCSKCFHSYHYIDGKKIGEFKAYRLSEFSDAAAENFGPNTDSAAADDSIEFSADFTIENASSSYNQSNYTAKNNNQENYSSNERDVKIFKEENE